MMFSNTRIPIFPLGLVLLPDMLVPLHIFEDRYKKMIGRCLEHEEVFGLVYYNGSRIARAGCTARVVEVLKKYDDGRMDIVTRGEDRFDIVELFDDKPYLEAQVDYFEDEFEPNTPGLEGLADSLRNLLRELFALSGAEEQRIIDAVDTPTLSFLAAFHNSIPPDIKQKLLEMRSTSERLQREIDIMEKMIERLKGERAIDKIVQSNGHLPGLK